MDASQNDVTPMLSATYQSDEIDDASRYERFSYRARSASLSIPVNFMESYQTDNAFVGYTGPLTSERRTSAIQMSGPLHLARKPENSKTRPSQVAPGLKSWMEMEKYPSFSERESNDWTDNDYSPKNQHLLRSGKLGMCNDPYCTTCPTIDNLKAQNKKSKSPETSDHKSHNMVYGDARGCAKKISSFMCSCIPGVMNPHTTAVQRWNKFFAVSCLFAIFIDPLFFFLLSVKQEQKCIIFNWRLMNAIVVLRSLTDFIYLIHMLLQFRLAFIAPESTVMGVGDLVDHPKEIALHYLKGRFSLDFFDVLPFPQIIVLLFLRGSSSANYAKNLLLAAIFVQYVPRLYRFFHLLAGQSPSGFIFESAWGNFVINLLTFVLASHAVGSCWYLLGLQRVNRCLRNSCHGSKIEGCRKFIDCGYSNNYTDFSSLKLWREWNNSANANACFSKDGFDYGIYGQAVNLTTKNNVVTRYVYSLFWGFQQISTLAGNQVPSYFEWEVLFTMGIIALGLLLFALLIGNMQNFLQSLGRRQLDMSLRKRDVEQWMSHRCLPVELRRRIRQAERYTWAASRGVNEEKLLEDLPEDIQRDIRRHLFKFVKEVRIFAVLDDTVLDSIRERLRHKTYIKGSIVLHQGGLINKMVYIIRGTMKSTGEDGNEALLYKGIACGEELLTWCLEHSSASKDARNMRVPGHRQISNRVVQCQTNVEAFILRATDLEEVTAVFARFFRSPRVHGAISP